VRPFVVSALIKNITMTDELIKSLMDLQEKLHLGIGRGRKKVAIGVHDFDAVKPPFTYKAVDPDSVEFIPLNKSESMTLREILMHHEKGIAYAHILKEFDKHPLIVDVNDNVLSYPPIINGTLTEVTPFTRNLFIDVTGTDKKAINYVLNIITTALAERNGKIFSTIIKDEGKIFFTPDLNPVKKEISLDYINYILGTNINDKDAVFYLKKMGYNAMGKKEKIKIEIPAYRADILHDIDIVEDVAIGYGYDKFETDFPKALTFGRAFADYELHECFRKIMIGLGFNEVTTFTISNDKDEFIKMGLDITSRVEIDNPIGEEYSCLRTSLIPSLLKILNQNKHHSLPQQIFELGIVVNNDFKNQNNLAFVKIDAKASFTECKSFTDAIMRDSGFKYEIKEDDHPGFINGRCVSIIYKNRKIGIYGELHPKTIINFELEHPIIAFEMNIDLLNQ
ncbi:MAG: phenylalanine--tRNA ligase subunit beta, partial [Thermoplasmatota archaeon]